MNSFGASLVALAMVAAVGLAVAQPSPPSRTADETAVLAADARQRDAVASGDGARVAALAHANLLVNAPSNRVLTRDDVVRMVATGEIANDNWERTPESVAVTGNVGVVMGRETLVTVAGSEQAQMFGAGKKLDRRFTNVYVREGGDWRFLARHAHVVSPAMPGAPK